MEKTVERAHEMIHDLRRAGISGQKIAKGSGVNPVTIGQIRNGKSGRITEKIFDRIWDFWSENAPPKDEREAARKELEGYYHSSIGVRMV
ncbi:MAG: hypothetical protein JXA28_00860 [Bacteroidetes bacterium]|nr:hypothetical protein [Bacteroidota bacterium]